MKLNLSIDQLVLFSPSILALSLVVDRSSHHGNISLFDWLGLLSTQALRFEPSLNHKLYPFPFPLVTDQVVSERKASSARLRIGWTRKHHLSGKYVSQGPPYKAPHSHTEHCDPTGKGVLQLCQRLQTVWQGQPFA